MKKHELLEKAMRDYPAGTKFETVCFNKVSTGKFTTWKPNFNKLANKDAVWRINEFGDPEGMVYDGYEWVKIFPDTFECAECERETETSLRTESRPNVCRNCSEPKPGILTGKCAIAVNNEREFKLLMDHYEGKGWRSLSDDTPSRVGYVPFTWSYEDSFGHAQEEFRKSEGSRVIPFADFAAEVGVTVPVFVMQSEDGVPLYEGDNYYRAGRSGANGKGDFVLFETNGLRKCHFVCSYPEIDKAFSTKEAAEAWILEANRPKSIRLETTGGGHVLITKHTVDFNMVASHKQLSGVFFDKIVDARKSLQ